MKTRTAVLIPFALALMTTACSTTTNTSSQGASSSNRGNEQNSSEQTPSWWLQQSQAKDQKIQALEAKLADNKVKLNDLQKRLDEKDALIAALQAPLSNADSIIALDKETRLRQSLESQYAELNMENNRLNNAIAQLKSDNVNLKKQLANQGNVGQKVSVKADDDYVVLNNSYQTLRSAHYALNKKYQTLQSKEKALQDQYDKLALDNLANQKALDSLKAENLTLGGQISDARAQQESLWDKIHVQEGMIKQMESALASQYSNAGNNDSTGVTSDSGALRSELTKLKAQLNTQRTLISDYQRRTRELKEALVDHKVSRQRMMALESQLTRLKRLNTEATRALQNSDKALLASQAQAESLSSDLDRVEKEKASLTEQLASLQASVEKNRDERARLESQVNDLIPFQAEVASLKNQLTVSFQNVTWQLPKEASLHNSFEIIVTARVANPVAGQSYVAQLVTDSAIQMISSPKVEAMLQNGQLQWRWRLNGLNERPNAKLNLFVSQEMNYNNQAILRQVYNGSETMALNNDNLLDKYGFWAGAILLGLAGGFGIGYMSRKKKKL